MDWKTLPDWIGFCPCARNPLAMEAEAKSVSAQKCHEVVQMRPATQLQAPTRR
jgi:hypothetical protein